MESERTASDQATRAQVSLAARRLERLEALATEIRPAGGTAYPLATDVTKADELKRMVAAAVERYGRLDYAVNNAGASDRGPFMDLRVEDFDRVMETNVRGVFLAMQAEIPALLESGGGAIVNTASVGGLLGVPGLSSYVASKWALIGLTKSVALEYATQNIRIDAIAPGATATEMLAGGTQAQRDFSMSLALIKRLAEPVEIARGIVYLLADGTSLLELRCRPMAGSPCLSGSGASQPCRADEAHGIVRRNACQACNWRHLTPEPLNPRAGLLTSSH